MRSISDPEGGTGDVKYHLAASESRVTAAGEIEVTVASNPSHLEAVDPVVEGLARAEQTDRSYGAGIHDPSVALSVLIHGDASFAGQGVVAETFNLHSLDGYSTGGTLHLIAEQPGQVHDRPRRRQVDCGTRATSRRGSTSRSSTSTPTIPMLRSRRSRLALGLPRGVRPRRRRRPRRLPALRPQRSRTRPRTRSRCRRSASSSSAPFGRRTPSAWSPDGVVAPDAAARMLEEPLEELRSAHDDLRSSFASTTPPPEPQRDRTRVPR